VDYSYPPEARSTISKLIEIADETRLELSNKLGTYVLSNVHVRIARTPREMATLAPENAPYPRYAAGVAYPDLGLILITIEASSPNQHNDIVETFKHELGHLALHDAVKGHDIPRWFNEGFAVFVSGESSLPRLQTLWTATVSRNLIPLDRLERGFPVDAQTASVAYAEAADVVRYLVRQQERYRFDALVERMSRGANFDEALRLAYNIDRNTLETEWREDVARRYTIWPILTSTSLLWVGIIGLFFFAYRKKKARAKATLERWRYEEEREDARNAARHILFENALERAAIEPLRRVHIVVASPTQPPTAKGAQVQEADTEIPKISHDGGIHTLH
jgi:hypothetical protein